MTRQRMPAIQRKNLAALLKTRDQVRKLTLDLHRAYDRRHTLIMRILNELEKNPSLYAHSKRDAKTGKKRSEPLTLAEVQKFRARYLKALRPLLISGPGCDSPPACPPKQDCVCVFGVGPVCCYLCLDIKVVQCDF